MKLILYILFLLMNCMSSIHQFSQSDAVMIQDYSSAKKIESEGSQFTILGFIYDTNYVEQAVEKLIEQCPNGEVDKIGTVFKTELGFLSWTNKIKLTGYCVDSNLNSKESKK